MYKLYLIIFFLAILTSGCASERNLVVAIFDSERGSSQARLIQQARDLYEKEYVGKSKDYLFNNLGKPREVNSDAWIHGEKHDEYWYYNFSKGYFKEAHSEPAKAVWFYISDDMVQGVKVF